MLLNQLAAVIGKEARDAGIRRYYDEWAFKHPGPIDFKRVMERESGLELDTYFQYMLNSTHHVDVAITAVRITEDSTFIDLERIGKLPLPVDLRITAADGQVMDHHIPQVVTQGHRPLAEGEALLPRLALDATDLHGGIGRVHAGQHHRNRSRRWTADANRKNNTVTFESGLLQEWRGPASDR